MPENQTSQLESETHTVPGRLLIADPHPLVRQGYCQVLAPHPDLRMVGEVASGAEAVPMIRRLKPDLVVMELTFHDGGGLEWIKRLKAQHDGLEVLVASARDERLYARRVLQAGASGYVHKSEDPEVLVRAVRKVLEGGISLSSSTAEWMVRRAVHRDGGQSQRVEALSDRELEVLELLGQGLGSAQIAERLYLSPKTVDTYREHLKTKLGLENSAQLIRYAVWWGLQQS
jgi:DNA-binding NarL/FixJ family response regulator